MTIKIPGLDAQKGLELYDDDEDIYLTVLRSYVHNIPDSLEVLRNVSAETLQDYYIKAHGLKGTSANIGAEDVRQLALKLETMAKSGDLNGVLAENETLIKLAEELIGNIKKWLDENDAKT